MPFKLPDGLKITWLGHATFLVETPAGKRILLDAWLQNNPATPADKKDPGPLDLILITHGHFDHIEDAVPLAKANNCPIVGIFEISAYLQRQGVSPEKALPMNKGGSLSLDDVGVTITMVHADHSCGIKDGDQIIYGGEAVGYIITLADGFTLYHTGDTAVFSDMELIADLYRPHLVMLPIGDRFVMSPREAARAVKFLAKSVEAVIPMHFGTFPLLTGTPDAVAQALADEGVSPALLTMTPGETISG